MAARLATLAPRLIALVVIWLLAAASWTLAAGGPQDSETATTAPAAGEPAKPEVLVVPDVKRQAYVFAKGILQDAGFAWRVKGAVKGYAANTVATQSPAAGHAGRRQRRAPGRRHPASRSTEYAERGVPENESPYEGTPVVLMSDWHAEQPPGRDRSRAAGDHDRSGPRPRPHRPRRPRPQRPPPPLRRPPPSRSRAPTAPRTSSFRARRASPSTRCRSRSARRSSSAAWPRSRRGPGEKFVGHWLYQHAWIVTGAGFGWRNGDDALRTLVQVDRSLYVRFGFGAKSEQVARRMLAWVESQKG